MRFALLLAVTVCLGTSPLRAATIHVPADQPTIQEGIDAASPGDTVLIACGDYHFGTGDPIGMASGITLRSETGSPDCARIVAAPLQCVDLDPSTTVEGMGLEWWEEYYSPYEGDGAALSLTRSSIQIVNCTLRGSAVGRGGAVMCAESSPLFLGCLFYQGRSVSGGGIFIDASPNPRFIDCTFRDCAAPGGGGAVSVQNSAPVFRNCSFTDNVVWDNRGGAILTDASSLDIAECEFSGNFAIESGGALFQSGGPPLTITDCRFFGQNQAGVPSAGVGGSGGAIHCEVPLTVTRCEFSENVAIVGGAIFAPAGITATECSFVSNDGGGRFGGGGGAIWCAGPSQVTSCTFDANKVHSNYVPASGAGIFYEGSALLVSGCTFAGQGMSVFDVGVLGAGLHIEPSSQVTIESTIIAFSTHGEAVSCADASVAPHCCDLYGNAGGDWVGPIAGQAGIEGNFSADPLFCSEAAEDYMLSADSPCLDAPGCGLVGRWGLGCGVATSVAGSAATSASWGRLKNDFVHRRP